MIGKKTKIAAVMATGVMLLTGCELLNQDTWQPQESAAISIDREGSITEIIHETLDAAYYDATELENMIYSEVADYNVSYGEDAIQVDTFVAEGKDVNLVMKYASAEDYARFNNTEFFYGSMINAQLEGYLFDVSYKRVNDGVVQGSLVSGTEVIKSMDKQVLVLRAPMEVRVPGDVMYTSANASVLAADVVDATGEQLEEEQGLVLPSNAVYKGTEATFEEKAAASRVYIIFNDL